MYKNFKLLIVDDEKDLGDLMVILLKESGVQISRASSLKDGKSLWELELPPVVLLDNNLPDGLGIEMIETNKHLLLNCKVIMVTADEKSGVKKRAVAAGIHYFIQKPFSLKVIREIMHKVFK